MLLGYLVNTSIPLETRATAAEIVVDAGWRTTDALRKWLAERTVSENEIAALLAEVQPGDKKE